MTPALITGPGRLTVIVTDLENMPLGGVDVEICSSALDRIQTGVTNAQGVCVFKDLPAGSYQVKFLSGRKKIASRKIAVSSESAVLSTSIKRPLGRILHGDFPIPLPVDPAITSFTSSDAKILNEASSALNKSIASTWDQISSAADVCERREILIEALENWRDMLRKTREELESPPQAHEKRFMIETVFEGMVEHLRSDLDSVSEFAQNTSRLRVALGTIANVLKRASESGAATFDLQVVSYPTDANASYSYQESETAKEHSERTPTTIKDLYYAECQIIIKHEGYYAAWSFYDPYSSLKDGVHQLRVNLLDESQNGYQRIPSLEERVHESDLIISGGVQHVQSRRDEVGSDVYTYTTIAVKECIKGSNVLRGDNIVIRDLGGSIKEEGVIQYVVGHPAGLSPPRFEKGERVLLLLRRLPESGHYQVVAGQHGKFSIMKDDVLVVIYVPLKDFIRKIKEIIKSG
jgi:hypothetical protein